MFAIIKTLTTSPTVCEELLQSKVRKTKPTKVEREQYYCCFRSLLTTPGEVKPHRYTSRPATGDLAWKYPLVLCHKTRSMKIRPSIMRLYVYALLRPVISLTQIRSFHHSAESQVQCNTHHSEHTRSPWGELCWVRTHLSLKLQILPAGSDSDIKTRGSHNHASDIGSSSLWNWHIAPAGSAVHSLHGAVTILLLQKRQIKSAAENDATRR